MFIALGVLFPYFTAHAFGVPGTIFLPMHLPVLLCGLICGKKYGLICGVFAPVLSSFITGMPVAYPMLPIMVIELMIYGLVGGFLLHTPFKFKGKTIKLNIYIALPLAMVAGRIGYAIMFAILNSITPGIRALTVYMAFVTGIPGILTQLLVIPIIVKRFHKTQGAISHLQ